MKTEKVTFIVILKNRIMGSCCSCFEETNPTVTFLGLCDSGKTTIIEYIEHRAFRLTHPTLGFERSNVVYQDKRVDIWDVSGRDCAYWSRYYYSSSGIVFVLDGTNLKDVDLFVEYVKLALANKVVQKVPILIFVNKIWGEENEPFCQTLAAKLELKQRDLNVKIQMCDPKIGKGVSEGFSWIMEQIFN
jgi:small GTP-binding protein